MRFAVLDHVMRLIRPLLWLVDLAKMAADIDLGENSLSPKVAVEAPPLQLCFSCQSVCTVGVTCWNEVLENGVSENRLF